MRTVFSLALFVIFSFVSFLLLKEDYLKSNDFVLLIVFSAIIALVISYFEEIQELSIGGNIVKLKEANRELKVTIEQLKAIKVSTFRMLLLKSLHHSGGFGVTSIVDSRVDYFLSLISEIKGAECFEDLKSEIKEPLETLLKDQLRRFHGLFYNKIFIDGDDFPKPMNLYVDLTPEKIEIVYSNHTPPIPFDQKKQAIIDGLDAYKKLYLLFKEVE